MAVRLCERIDPIAPLRALIEGICFRRLYGQQLDDAKTWNGEESYHVPPCHWGTNIPHARPIRRAASNDTDPTIEVPQFEQAHASEEKAARVSRTVHQGPEMRVIMDWPTQCYVICSIIGFETDLPSHMVSRCSTAFTT